MSNLEKKFEKMGARLHVRSQEPLFRRSLAGNKEMGSGAARLDVLKDKSGEYFDINIFGDAPPQVQVLDVQPQDRHLLLLVKQQSGAKSKFLCGHDERHWFVAAIPESAPVGTVRQAKEALKPAEVQGRQVGLKAKDRNRRKNKAYTRQGEWFFVQADISEPDPMLVLKYEPLSRGRGSKPHTVEFCYRKGGETVYVSRQYPNGVNQETYNKLMKSGEAKTQGWQVMTKDAQVYVKGKVTHADHATITLDSWCRVLMNTENKAQAMRHVAFLD